MYGCMASSFSILPCTLPRHYVSSASCTSTLCAAPYVQIMHSWHDLFYFSQVDLLLQHQFFMSHALLLALWLGLSICDICVAIVTFGTVYSIRHSGRKQEHTFPLYFELLHLLYQLSSALRAEREFRPNALLSLVSKQYTLSNKEPY